ncbi:uncharacterized protein BDZ99DRAFT_25668 [Mytilinidion resinicola]|uniref:Uncharacterized protein n=1 Tax=Mytilinidion resinicola TaxID=574789 RepID=A0A6A6YKC3_9PEZI|nr:uncharacterized protein BDZ99DRAFT_25668 [Mytilinidion resinicola]KAF2809271.1 hypothetical protein BDZ99DRAFT_25668 [Mytilinidion resinicola]
MLALFISPDEDADPAVSKAAVLMAYLTHLAASLVPAVAALAVPHSEKDHRDLLSSRDVLEVGFFTIHVVILNPLTTLLVLYAFVPQYYVIKAARGAGESALSAAMLGSQSIVFAVLAASWVWRAPGAEGEGVVWWWFVESGWMGVDAVVFAGVQGALWLVTFQHARKLAQAGVEGREEVEGEEGEQGEETPLLRSRYRGDGGGEREEQTLLLGSDGGCDDVDVERVVR